AVAADLPREADLVVVTGDSVARRNPEDAEFVARVLREAVRAHIGYFAVLGNHDYAVTGPPGRESRADLTLAAEVAARMGAQGFVVLRNEWVRARPDLVVAGAADGGARPNRADAPPPPPPPNVPPLLPLPPPPPRP